MGQSDIKQYHNPIQYLTCSASPFAFFWPGCGTAQLTHASAILLGNITPWNYSISNWLSCAVLGGIGHDTILRLLWNSYIDLGPWFSKICYIFDGIHIIKCSSLRKRNSHFLTSVSPTINGNLDFYKIENVQVNNFMQSKWREIQRVLRVDIYDSVI